MATVLRLRIRGRYILKVYCPVHLCKKRCDVWILATKKKTTINNNNRITVWDEQERSDRLEYSSITAKLFRRDSHWDESIRYWSAAALAHYMYEIASNGQRRRTDIQLLGEALVQSDAFLVTIVTESHDKSIPKQVLSFRDRCALLWKRHHHCNIHRHVPPNLEDSEMEWQRLNSSLDRTVQPSLQTAVVLISFDVSKWILAAIWLLSTAIVLRSLQPVPWISTGIGILTLHTNLRFYPMKNLCTKAIDC